jgi:hypothetical protein
MGAAIQLYCPEAALRSSWREAREPKNLVFPPSRLPVDSLSLALFRALDDVEAEGGLDEIRDLAGGELEGGLFEGGHHHAAAKAAE